MMLITAQAHNKTKRRPQRHRANDKTTGTNTENKTTKLTTSIISQKKSPSKQAQEKRRIKSWMS